MRAVRLANPKSITISDNPNYVDQVAAMEAKARELGVGRKIHYMFPMNSFLNDADIAKAVALEPRIDSQLLADLHVGGGGAVGTAEALFQTVRKRLFCAVCMLSRGCVQANLTKPGLMPGAVNAETNAGTHTFERAMSEAADLNDWFNAKIVSADAASNRLHFRAASFCTASANDFDNWDQGISFFLVRRPDSVWLPSSI